MVLPLDPAKGSSTLWTPFRAIELVTTAYFFRVFIGGTQGALPLDPAREFLP
ncbi:unknown [Faecalibacterium sp. CAG:74]|nr:unknown [Faecalibacterium sp. CAG:74]